MKKALIITIIMGFVLLISGKVIMSHNSNDSDFIFADGEDLTFDGEKETINKEFEYVKEIDLSLGFYSIIIEEDSSIKGVHVKLIKPIIKMNGKDINKIECKNGKLIISQIQKKFLNWNNSFNFEKIKGELLIKIPSKSELSNISISNGVGSIKLNNIYSKSLEISSGTATVEISGTDIGDCNISGGTGRINLKDVSIDKLIVESGTGSISVDGDIRKKIDISSGTGSIDLKLEGKEKDYNYDIGTGLGRIEINKNTYKKEVNINNKSSYCDIKINTGTGSVKIETR